MVELCLPSQSFARLITKTKISFKNVDDWMLVQLTTRPQIFSRYSLDWPQFATFESHSPMKNFNNKKLDSGIDKLDPDVVGAHAEQYLSRVDCGSG